MTKLLSTDGVDITQKNFQQILIRGDGREQFNQVINKEITLQPPSKNLEVKTNDKFIDLRNYNAGIYLFKVWDYSNKKSKSIRIIKK